MAFLIGAGMGFTRGVVRKKGEVCGIIKDVRGQPGTGASFKNR
ncbi:hypothetical protein [Neobacillus vireti]